MARLRRIAMASEGVVVVKVFRNSEWNEYVVKAYVRDIPRTGANYHTDDKQDALDTMHHMGKHFLRCVRKGEL